MTYNLLLFDLDGTLTDSKTGITKGVAHALRASGVDAPNPDSLERFIGPPLRVALREFYGLSDAQAEPVVTKYREYYSEIGIFENAPYPGIAGLLRRLKGAGLTLAVATSKPVVFARRIVGHFDLAQYFDIVAGGEFDHSRDTKAAVIAYALEQIDPRRELRAVMIGDRKYDIAGARETGIDSIGALWGYGSRGELETAGATRVVATVEELGGALLG